MRALASEPFGVPDQRHDAQTSHARGASAGPKQLEETDPVVTGLRIRVGEFFGGADDDVPARVFEARGSHIRAHGGVGHEASGQHRILESFRNRITGDDKSLHQDAHRRADVAQRDEARPVGRRQGAPLEIADTDGHFSLPVSQAKSVIGKRRS